ncbi:MAG: EboA domain-containing protein [Burkholderiaceae bacterium]
MSTLASSLLLEMLYKQLGETERAWLAQQQTGLAADPSDANLHIALGMVPRKLGKADLNVTQADASAATAAIPGWDLTGWSVPDAARAVLLASLPDDGKAFAARFKSLCQTADVAESVGLFRSLPLAPSPGLLQDVVADGLRTNMKAVFEAIAHRNPYPREHFDEHRWNHMVLKALFIGSRLAPIQGLDERANPDLSRIMRDFAHERWAADRPVPVEIWRCVGPFAVDDDALADLKRVLASPDDRERMAGTLALAACGSDKAIKILQTVPDIAAQVQSGDLTWDSPAFSEQ